MLRSGRTSSICSRGRYAGCSPLDQKRLRLVQMLQLLLCSALRGRRQSELALEVLRRIVCIYSLSIGNQVDSPKLKDHPTLSARYVRSVSSILRRALRSSTFESKPLFFSAAALCNNAAQQCHLHHRPGQAGLGRSFPKSAPLPSWPSRILKLYPFKNSTRSRKGSHEVELTRISISLEDREQLLCECVPVAWRSFPASKLSVSAYRSSSSMR